MTVTDWREQTQHVTHRLSVRPRAQVIVGFILLAAAFPVRFAVSGGLSASLFDVAVAVAAILLLFMLPFRPVPPIPKPFLWLAYISILASVASIGWSSDASSTQLYVVSSVEALLVFVTVVTLLRDAPPTQIARLIGGWIVLLLIGSTLLWLRVPGFMPPSELDPTSGDYISYFARLSHPFIGRSNNLAALLSLFIIPLAVWSWRTKHRFAGFAAALAFGATVLTLSRGTLLALVAGVIVYLVVDGKNGRRFVRRITAPLVIIVGLAWWVIASNSTAINFFASRFDNSGYTSRSDLLAYSREAILSAWVLGSGAGTGADVHNTFMEQLVYFGVFLGLIVCGALIGVVAWWFRKQHADQRWLARAIGIGFVVQFSSFLVESSYEGTLLRPLIWMSWGLLLAFLNAEKASPPAASGVNTRRSD